MRFRECPNDSSADELQVEIVDDVDLSDGTTIKRATIRKGINNSNLKLNLDLIGESHQISFEKSIKSETAVGEDNEILVR